MLGGANLGIDLNAPKVIARIFPEKDGKLKTALEVRIDFGLNKRKFSPDF